MGTFTSSLSSLGGGTSKSTFVDTLAPSPSSPGANRFAPAIPETFEELGLAQSFVTDLVLRRLILEGFSSLSSLSHTLKLSVSIIDIVFKHLRAHVISRLHMAKVKPA